MTSASAMERARAAMSRADTDPGRAPGLAAEALAAARRERDPHAAAVAQRAWGHALLQCGDVDAAIAHLRQSIRYGHRAGSAELAAEARIKLAYALVMRGRPRAALVEIGAAAAAASGVAAARARGQRGVILSEIGRLDEALVDFQAALPALRAAADDLSVARTLVNRGIVHAHRFAFGAATKDLREAEALSRRMGRDLAVGIIAENLGYVETLRGDVPAALAHLDRAEAIIGANRGQVAPVHHDRGVLLLSVGLAAEAAEAAGAAVSAYQREDRHLKVPEARLLLAQAAIAAGDPNAAARQAGQAVREFGRQGRPQWAAMARLEQVRAEDRAGSRSVSDRAVAAMVRTLDAAGWPAAAVEAHLAAARRIGPRRGRRALAHLAAASRAVRRGPATLRARGWYAEALLRLANADRARARGAIRTGLRILDEHSLLMGAADVRVHSAAHRVDLTELGLRLALADGPASVVFEWAERGRASRIGYRPARPPADPRLADLLARLRRVALDLANDPAGGSPAQRADQVGLERRIRDLERMRRAGPGQRPPPPVAVGELGEALGERAVVEFVALDGVLHGLWLAGGRARSWTIGALRPVADLVQRLPFGLRRLAGSTERPDVRSAVMGLLRAAAADLDALLLGSCPWLDDRPLVVVPTGCLHSLPWSLLPSCAGRPVVVCPSATLWYAIMTRPAANGAGGAVAVVAGPGLPGARLEAEQVAAIHGAPAIVDAAATIETVLAALRTASTFHLAAHGRLSADNPLFSSLLLADGPLVVYDLEGLERAPHTVVLAACEGGRSATYAGDELLGLSVALTARGTAHLVASVIPIPDAETAPLMVDLHRRLAGGAAPAAALAATQQAARSADPAVLAAAAGFVCLGAGF